MATSKQHLQLYGRIRKVLLSRYFALGRYFRNDYFQESTNIEAMSGVPEDEIGKKKKEILKEGGEALIKALWRKNPADRDNPWLFGSKLTIALATEARLGLPGALPGTSGTPSWASPGGTSFTGTDPISPTIYGAGSI